MSLEFIKFEFLGFEVKKFKLLQSPGKCFKKTIGKHFGQPCVQSGDKFQNTDYLGAFSESNKNIY